LEEVDEFGSKRTEREGEREGGYVERREAEERGGKAEGKRKRDRERERERAV